MTTRLLKNETPTTAPAIFMDPRNPYAPHLLQDYAARLETVGLPGLAEQARKHAQDIFDWQQANGVETLADPLPKPVEHPKKTEGRR